MTGGADAVVRTGRALAAASVIAAVAGTAGLVAQRRWDLLIGQSTAHQAVLALGFGIVCWVTLPGQPENRAVWVLTIAAAFSALDVAGSCYVVAAAGNPTAATLEELTPAALPPAASFALPVFAWTSVPGLGLVLTLGLLLFPDGRFSSPLSRVVGATSVVLIAAVSLALAWVDRPSSAVRLGAETGEYTGIGRVVGPATLALLAAAAYAVVSLLRRFSSSAGETRRQYAWVVLGMAVLVSALVAPILAEGLGSRSGVGSLVELTGVSVAVAAYGVALVRYRLWSIDVMINKAIVFAVLAAFVTAVYSVVAVGAGRLVGRSGLWWSIAATAVVAMAFEPARTTAQRWVNRIVYGRRATPYEVLSEITSRFATAGSRRAQVERMATLLAAGTGARRATVWLADGDQFVAAASSPPGAPLAISDRVTLPGLVELVEYDDEVLGALTVEKPRGDAVGPTERALMADLAGSVALVLRRMRLEETLREAAGELDRSRRRLVGVQEAEQRRLEGELHDRVEQRVADLLAALVEVRGRAEEDAAPRLAGLIGELVEDAGRAIGQIRSLARGLVPPVLEAEGLGGALHALASSSPGDVCVGVNLMRPHPPELEAAVYFCVSEALTNASKYGRSPVVVSVRDAGGHLDFEVTDGGPGFDPRQVNAGAGLKNMADRLDALGGSAMIVSAPGACTTVSGTLPVGAMATI